MSDDMFIKGLNFKAPRANAPSFVKVTGSIKRADLIATLTARDDEWINFDVKESKGGKWYAAINGWKPEGGKPAPQRQVRPQHQDGAQLDDDIPF